MPRDVIAIGLGNKSRQVVNDLSRDIIDGDFIVLKAYCDQLGININEFYAKKTDIDHITVDIEAYTDEEIDSLLGIS